MSDLRMPDLNRVIIAGRATRDPELKYTQSGKPFAKLSIANSRRYKLQGQTEWQEETCFLDITLWGPAAEYAGQHFKKGHALLAEGRLKTEEWEDKATGQRRSKIGLNADRVTPLEWTGDKAAGGGASSAAPANARPPQGEHYDDPIPEDDLPF